PQTLPFDAFCIPPSYYGLPVPVATLARFARHAHAPTHVWTVNDADQAIRLWERGIRGIISDDPAAILAARARRDAGNTSARA
nr:hypothetical protein [Gemmatimonadaceae bacterium]